MVAHFMYGHLSGDAHSGSRIVFQTRAAIVAGEPQKLLAASMQTMNILCANMITDHTSFCPESRAVLESSVTENFVKAWINIGAHLRE